MTDHANRERLKDTPERRSLPAPLELRENTDGTVVMEGYAATWEPYDCYGGPDAGGWVEQLSRSAFQRTLSENPDVLLLINHEGLPIARTVSGNLHLSTDNHGLRMRADLDPTDPDVMRLIPKMRSRGKDRPIMDEMSFSFRVKSQEWDANYTNRSINELSLQKGDVSIVNYGMNPGTRAVLGQDAVGALASLSNEGQLELRKLDRTQIGRAMLTLERAWRSGSIPESERGDFGGKKAPPFKKGGGKEGDDDKQDDDDQRATWVSADGGHLLYDGQCVTCSGDRAAEPYGAVPYADPGYLGPDRKPAHDGNGVKRYPIDAKHVQAAWSYINMPKNQKGYTAEQLSAIKGRIKAAMKKHGHDVSEDKNLRDAGMCSCPDDDCPVHGDRQEEDSRAVEFDHYDSVRALGGGVTLVAVMSDGSRIPLPAFREYGSPAAGTFRAGPGGGVASNIVGGAQVTPKWDPPADLVSQAAQDSMPYTKSDLGALDPGELHGKPAPQPSAEVGSGFRSMPDNPTQVIDTIRQKEGDEPDDDTEDEDDTTGRSIDAQLRELRREGDLPLMPTVTEALDYIRKLA